MQPSSNGITTTPLIDYEKQARLFPYPPPTRDDAIMMAALARIESKLDELLSRIKCA